MLRYIKDTFDYRLRYMKTEQFLLTGYSDSDYASDYDNQKSTLGIIYFIRDNVITWVSQMQKVISLSSCEAKYIALTIIACQGI